MKIVNHSKYYVSEDKLHTNSIKLCCHHLKTEKICKMRNFLTHLLQEYLIKASIRSKFNIYFDLFKYIIKTLESIFLLNIINNINFF